MINIKDMQTHAFNTMKQMNEGDRLIYRTFKKDRSITILCHNETFSIKEDGFEKKFFESLSLKEARKTIKKLQGTEFPRSNRIWDSVTKAK